MTDLLKSAAPAGLWDVAVPLLRAGDSVGAVTAWREALAADPNNFVIRKQMWAVEHPGRFYPTIDFAWQKDQLARERAAEDRDPQGK